MAEIYLPPLSGPGCIPGAFFISISSFHPQGSPKRQALFYPFYRWANWGTVMLFNELSWGLTTGRKCDFRATTLYHCTRMNRGHAGMLCHAWWNDLGNGRIWTWFHFQPYGNQLPVCDIGHSMWPFSASVCSSLKWGYFTQIMREEKMW